MILRKIRQQSIWAKIFLLGCYSIIFSPKAAWALQTHPAPEGLYAHQLAHLFFIATLGIFTYWLHSTGLVRERGWRLIQISCFMFILWNLDTFTVHWIEHTVTRDMFIDTGLDWSQRLNALTAEATVPQVAPDVARESFAEVQGELFP